MKAFTTRPEAGQRLDCESGAAFLEFAVMLPLLLALLLGVTTSGMAINSTNSINNAARESARFGATLPNDNLTLWLNEVADLAIDAASGELDDGKPGRYVCVAFVHPAGPTSARLEVDAAGTRTLTADSDCFPDGRPNDERRVQVLLEREAELQFVFFDSTVTLDGQTTAVFEEL